MDELPLHAFKHAIRSQHNAGAMLIDRVPVVERFEGEIVWQGEVLVFDLEGHPSATRCYAWADGDDVTAVLAEGAIDSPQAAVQAAIY